MFLDRRCPGCGVTARTVCPRCERLLCRPPPPAARAVAAEAAGLDGLVALGAYTPESRRLLLAAKNGGRRDVLRRLAAQLQPLVAKSGGRVDAITWVPASRRGRADRGYDQSQVLARVLAGGLGVGARRLLVRRGRHGQARASRQVRLEGPDLVARGRCPPSILLVDDVCTTGASLAAAATVLRQAGGLTVEAAVLALVPDRSRWEPPGPAKRTFDRMLDRPERVA